MESDIKFGDSWTATRRTGPLACRGWCETSSRGESCGCFPLCPLPPRPSESPTWQQQVALWSSQETEGQSKASAAACGSTSRGLTGDLHHTRWHSHVFAGTRMWQVRGNS
eukprot:1797380-Amphidinium_carterae.4